MRHAQRFQKHGIAYVFWIGISGINNFLNWIADDLSGILFTVYNIYRCSLKYSQYPVTTELSTEDGSNSSTSFPLGIPICMKIIMSYRIRYMADLNLSHDLFKFNAFKNENIKSECLQYILPENLSELEMNLSHYVFLVS